MMRDRCQWVFPEDKEAVYWEDEYFYGSDLLVAPVHQEGRKEENLLPIRKLDQFVGFQKDGWWKPNFSGGCSN